MMKNLPFSFIFIMNNPPAKSPRYNTNNKKVKDAMNRLTQENNKNNKPSKRNVNRRINQQKARPDQQSMFYAALTCPFDPAVLGVQVPDPFPFPTQVFHVHQTTVIGSNSLGNGCVAFMPNPALSLIDLNKMNNQQLSGSVQNTPFTIYSSNTQLQFANSTYGAVSPAALADVFADYRTVSWGIKISNLMPELVATGRIIIASIPLGDTIPSFPELQASNTPYTVEAIFGMNVQFLATSNVLELPTAFQLTAQDLLHGDIEIGGMYSAADFWDFKTTKTFGYTGITGNLTSVGGDSVSVGVPTQPGPTPQVITGYKDMTRCRGGSAIVIYFEGMPYTNVTNFFQVETIYHLEGTPNFSSTTNNALISSTARKASVGTSHGVEQVMTRASKMDNVVTWISKGADFLNQNKAQIFDVGKKIGLAAMTLL